MQPLVSVILPNYNHARFLDERIQSILSQTYDNFELIILDDNSTDNSLEVIEKYRLDKHISHIIYNPENSGSPFIQWNKGIELAKGRIIWIAESDDSCDKNMLGKLVNSYTINNAVFTFCRSQYYNDKGEKLQTVHNELLQDFSMNGKDFISQSLGFYNTVTNASSCIFDKDIAKQISKQYMDFRGSGDWLFWIELAECGQVSFVNESLNLFRTHSDNTTTKMYGNGVDFIEDYRIWEYLCKNKLLKHKDSWNQKRRYILKSLNYKFDDENIRQIVLKEWHYNNWTKFRIFIYRLLQYLSNRV